MTASLPAYLFVPAAPAQSCALRFSFFFDLTLSEECCHPSPQPYHLRVQTVPKYLPPSTHSPRKATRKVFRARINEKNKHALNRYQLSAFPEICHTVPAAYKIYSLEKQASSTPSSWTPKPKVWVLAEDALRYDLIVVNI